MRFKILITPPPRVPEAYVRERDRVPLGASDNNRARHLVRMDNGRSADPRPRELPASSTAAGCWPAASGLDRLGRAGRRPRRRAGHAPAGRDGDLVVARRRRHPRRRRGPAASSRGSRTAARPALVFVDGHYLTGALAGVRDDRGRARACRCSPCRAASTPRPRAPPWTRPWPAAARRRRPARSGRGAALRAGRGEAARPASSRRSPTSTGLGAVLQDAAGRRLAAAGRGDGPRIAVHAVAGGELALHGAAAGVLAEPLLAQAAALVALEVGRVATRRRGSGPARGGARAPVPGRARRRSRAGHRARGRRRRAGAGRPGCAELGADLRPRRRRPRRAAAGHGRPRPGRRGRRRAPPGAPAAASADGAARPGEARAARALGPALGRPPVYTHVRVADALLRALGPDGAAAWRTRRRSATSAAGTAGRRWPPCWNRVYRSPTRQIASTCTRTPSATACDGSRNLPVGVSTNLADRLEFEAAICSEIC